MRKLERWCSAPGCGRRLFRDEDNVFCPAGHAEGFAPLRECFPEDLVGIYFRPLRRCDRGCGKRVFTTGTHECVDGLAPNRKQRRATDDSAAGAQLALVGGLR